MEANDEIVISGISGRYPECDSFGEFVDALRNGVDLLTVDDRRFPPGTYGTPERQGKINNVEYFDNAFFNISPKQADLMDPRHRIILENTFEAIVDSGFNPAEVRGSNTGVYVALALMDNIQAYKELDETYGYSMTGTTSSKAANRVSYCFDFKGPSYVVDTACSAGMYAFVNAVNAMRQGHIDSAIVAALHINFHPHEAREFVKLNMLAPDGKCKVFCTDRDGYGRSEAAVCLFLQKKSQCRRIYATVLGEKTNCDGFKKEGITWPSSISQTQLLKEVYGEANIDPNTLDYVEMHGTGTPAGDFVECQTISNLFCNNRKTPLKIGAVKSNMGHSEMASGLCSISKVICAMETGIIPSNLHCDNLDYELPGIKEGTMKVITKNLPWKGGMVGLNSFGFGGANAHIILESNKHMKKNYPKRHDHRLVTVSGRTEESVKYYLEKIQKHQDDDEFLALVDEIHKLDVDGHYYRGYAILGDNPKTEIARISLEKRPIFFIYAGMGSQWVGMGKDLMKIEVFRKTIRKCADALKPYNIDLENVILSDDPKIFDNVENSFAAVIATEIALTDVLRSMGIEPDGMAGHSLGEAGCAYANGDLTPEQACLIGFGKGYGTVRSKSIPGQMAAIGLSRETCEQYLPEGVYIACENSSSSVTVTGPEKQVEMFVHGLTQKGIFARIVRTGGYAFHSKYVADASPILLNFVKKAVPNPKPRVSKWYSTSWPESEWHQKQAQLNSAEYHTHNYESPVLLKQVFKHIPKNAIVIEISPQAFLLSILKKELGPENTTFALANRTSPDNVEFLLSSIGKVYISGGQTNLRKFYGSTASFPVSRGTPNISSCIKWDHHTKWFCPYFVHKNYFGTLVKVNLSNEKYAYLDGHNIDDRILMPATGYLELVWNVQAELLSTKTENLPVVFENIEFLRSTVIPETQDVQFLVNIAKLSGAFEIFESGSVVCRGKIVCPKNISNEYIDIPPSKRVKNGYLPMKTNDVCKLFRLRRYFYTGKFCGISEIDVNGANATLKWNGSFTSYLDTMLQVSLINKEGSDMVLPTKLRKLVIDPQAHLNAAKKSKNELPVTFDKDLNAIESGGIQVIEVQVSKAPKRHQTQPEPIVETHVFVPYFTESPKEIDLVQILRIIFQIVLENCDSRHEIRAVDYTTDDTVEDIGLAEIITSHANKEPFATLDVVKLANANQDSYDLFIVDGKSCNKVNTQKLSANGFILFHGQKSDAESFGFNMVFSNSHQNNGLFLLRNTEKLSSYAVVNIRNTDFAWLNKIQEQVHDKDVIYLFSQNEELSGILGLMKCLVLEPQQKSIFKCVFIMDNDAEIFSVDSEFYSDQLENNLSFNVLRKGVWGSYRFLPLNQMQNIEVKHANNVIRTLGDFSSLTWIERPSSYYKITNDSEIAYVFYSALNFRDVMTAAGKVASVKQIDPTAPEYAVGLEFSGLTEKNKRVMGILPGVGIALQVTNDPSFTWEIPKSWTLEDAATVPIVYATVYYALIVRGNLQPGEKVLIHAGTGGIGIAAISVALSLNCKVFTTVSSNEKREFIKTTFPQIKDEQIGNSRNASFEQLIKKHTNGNGVDVVLNSLSAELFQASIRCLGRRGRFLEIGKVDLEIGTPISANIFSKNTSFHGVLIDDLFGSDCPVKEKIHKLVSEGIHNGVVRPLPRTVFKETEVEDAYRYLSTGKHKGKVLIKIRDETPANLKNPVRTISARPKIYFDPEMSYILIGGLGGFGLELVDFLIERNAKKIVLNSRNGVTQGYQSFCLNKWSNINGVSVKVNTDNSDTMQGAEKLVKFAEQLGPIGGIFNMALVLEDSLFISQTSESFKKVFASKLQSGSNMDIVTRSKCPHLEYFIVFSSLSCGRGNIGQTNYGMSNSALERLCEKRRADGLPALAIQWGPIGDVGVLANDEKYLKQLSAFKLVPQSIKSCLDTLEQFMLHPCTVGASNVINEQLWSTGPKLSEKTPSEVVAHILGIKNLDSVEKSRTLSDLGLDSLMTSEIKQTLYRNFSLEIDVEDIRNLTFGALETMSFGADIPNTTPTTKNMNGDIGLTITPILKKELIVEFKNGNQNKTIFFLHPIEGHVDYMTPLAKKLRATIYGLQCVNNLEFDQINDFANYFVTVIKSIQKEGPYHICGYSYGAALSFEIAVQLEKLGETVKLYLLDGSPSFLKGILAELHEKTKSIAKSRSNALKKFVEYFNIDPLKAQELVDASELWEKQLEIVSNEIQKETGHDAKEVAISADRFFRRIYAGYYYDPTDIFKGDAILLKSTNEFVQFPEDYCLQQICQKPIRIETLKGNHLQVLVGDNLNKVANTINKLLE